jgi:hypothetical protein
VPGAHQGGAADFSESLGPLADQDPALWIALLGAAQIVRRPRDQGDFYKLRDLPLAQFTRVKSGGSALYLLVGLEEDVGTLRVGLSSSKKPKPARWSEVKCAEGFQRLFHHSNFFARPRSALLSLAVGKISVVTFATAFLPNRATLVTVTQDRHGALQVHQMMLPLGHLVHKMPETVRDHLYVRGRGGPSRTRSVKFIVQAQRAFRQRQDIDSKGRVNAQELQELLYGKWLDPVMAALASYELLRRGKREHLLEVADNLQRYFSDFPDSGALARLVTAMVPRKRLSLADASRLRRLAKAKLPNGGWPLFLDGLAAFENYEHNLPLPAARLDYRGMWTLWRGALANPNE